MADFSDRIREKAEQAIRENVFPGCVVGILRDGKRQVFSFGRQTYENSPSVDEHTIYGLASVTKSIPLASLVALVVEEGKFLLSDSVAKYIPELRNHFDATIEDLLRYRVSGLRMSQLSFKTFEEMRTHIFETGFEGPPREESYSNLPASRSICTTRGSSWPSPS